MDLLGCRSLPFCTRRNYYYEMQNILWWSLLAGLVEGHFGAVVVAKTFNGSPLLISIATATPIAAMTFSLFFGALCVGRPKVRFASILCVGIALFAGSAGAIPLGESGAVWFIVQMAAAQILLAGLITLRSAIWKSNYPHMERGRITARLQAVREVVMVASSMSAAALCDKSPLSYSYIYPVAAILGSIGIISLQKLHIRGERAELQRLRGPCKEAESLGLGRTSSGSMNRLSPRHLLRNAARILVSDRRFSHYIVAQLCVGISNQLTIAVVALLITRQLDMGVGAGYWISTALLVALPKLFLLGSLSRWGRLFDRLGVVRFRVVNLFCWISSLVFGLAATLTLVYREEVGGMYLFVAVAFFAARGVFYGLGMGGGRLAWNIGHLHFAQSDEAEIYMGIHVSLTGIRGLVAPLAGMWLWQIVGWYVWLIALVFAFTSLALFRNLAKKEQRQGLPGV